MTKKLTDEEIVSNLLKPRYKVIADYPHSDYKVGDIIAFVREVAQSYDECKLSNGETTIFKPSISWLNKWPHIFKRLEWWQERGVDEMKKVQFVKVIKYRGYWRVGDIAPALLLLNERLEPLGFNLKYNHYQDLHELMPATEAEYLSFINQNTN